MRIKIIFGLAAIFLFIPNFNWAERIKLSATPAADGQKAKNKILGANANQIIYFRLTMEKKAEVELDIFNAKGKQVAVIKKTLPIGPGILAWDCASIPPGTFQAKLKVDGVEKKTRISLVK